MIEYDTKSCILCLLVVSYLKSQKWLFFQPILCSDYLPCISNILNERKSLCKFVFFASHKTARQKKFFSIGCFVSTWIELSSKDSWYLSSKFETKSKTNQEIRKKVDRRRKGSSIQESLLQSNWLAVDIVASYDSHFEASNIERKRKYANTCFNEVMHRMYLCVQLRITLINSFETLLKLLAQGMRLLHLDDQSLFWIHIWFFILYASNDTLCLIQNGKWIPG